jgi:hypothetical protein
VQLNPAELPALAARFPVFEAYAGRAAVASPLPTAELAALDEEPESAGPIAEITPPRLYPLSASYVLAIPPDVDRDPHREE